MTSINNEMLQLGVYALVVRGQGNDLLMGTNVHTYIKVKGLEPLLQKFIIDLDQAFDYIYQNDIKSFLSTLEHRFSIDLQELFANMVQNITAMQQIESDPVMIYYLVITKTLEYIRNSVFQSIGIQWLQKNYKNKYEVIPSDQWLDELECLDDSCNVDYSLLYNLIFIYFLAKLYEDTSVETITKKLIDEAIENLIANA